MVGHCQRAYAETFLVSHVHANVRNEPERVMLGHLHCPVHMCVTVQVTGALLRVFSVLMRSAFEAVQEPGEAAGSPRTDLDSRSPRGSLHAQVVSECDHRHSSPTAISARSGSFTDDCWRVVRRLLSKRMSWEPGKTRTVVVEYDQKGVQAACPFYL